MEMLDLYDYARQKQNAKIARGEKLPEGMCRLVIHVCIFNAKNEMMIQQRNANKKVLPNVWDVTLGGCVQAGENTQDAATRELGEELGLSIDFSNERPHLTVNFEGGFDDYYLVKKDVALDDVEFTDDEVQDVRYATKEEIFDMIENGQFINYHKSFIAALFEMKENRGSFAK